MCRIVGFWDTGYRGQYDPERTVISMRDAMAYGGPDDAGVYVDKNRGLALGHRRLSILDLSSLGHQPMCDDGESLWITYNGEVYNFSEIREELADKGYAFRSNSDTEVVLKAFRAWGLEAVRRFRGMFAFALWDRERERLVLCRDRAGVKPLYWYLKNGLFMFASELKAFHGHPAFKKEPDRRALSDFLTFGYIPSSRSIFLDTHKLEPGHFLIIDKQLGIEKIKYWDVEDHYRQASTTRWNKTDEETAEELESILRESFRLRMVSDVPVGVFLSGGIDSSAVTALLAEEGFRLKTFTIGFRETDYNEAEHAKRVADYLGTEHTELYCTHREAFDVIPKLPELYDEPFGDASAIPTHLVSILARQKVTVSLSADAGDETFCGYARYWMVKNTIQRLKKLPAQALIRRALDSISPDSALALYRTLGFILPKYTNFRDKYSKLRNVLKEEGLRDMYLASNSYFQKEELAALGLPAGYPVEVNPGGLDEFHMMMLADFKTYLPDDILTKVDRASMGVALESREPLLDHRITEYAAGMPINLKYRKGTSKYILRKILYKYVPREVLDRPKQGFSVPIYEWFREDLTHLFLHYLDEARIRREGILHPGPVKTLLKDYLDNRGVNVHKLWFLLMFEMWAERWL